ncbi:MAG: T9SS type A sorting domain-containing protein, partial [Bacteroidota bacterium]
MKNIYSLYLILFLGNATFAQSVQITREIDLTSETFFSPNIEEDVWGEKDFSYAKNEGCAPGFDGPCNTSNWDPTLGALSTGIPYLFSWNPIPDQVGCQIQVRFQNGSILGTKTLGGSEVSSFFVPFNFFQLFTTYEWRIRCACSCASNPLAITPWTQWSGFTTFPLEQAKISSLPNPTTGQSFVTFNVTQPEMTTLEVFDISGKMVEAIYSGIAQPNADYRFEFNGSDLPNGIYIYRLTTESEVKTEKFMIAR